MPAVVLYAAGMPDPTRKRCTQATVAALGILAALAAPARGAGAVEALRYTLRPDPEAGVLHVELLWETRGRRISGLRIARDWGPIRNVPGMLRDLRFLGARAKRAGGLWTLRHEKNATIRCSYTVDPQHRAFDEPRWAHVPITTRDVFCGMGPAFLLTPHPGGVAPQRYEVVLRWVLPKGWRAACSWGVGAHVGATLRAEDLRRSVYVAGRLVTRATKDAPGRVHVAVAGQFRFTADELLARARRIIDAQCAFVGETDFPDFVITLVAVGPPAGDGPAKLTGSGMYHSFALFLAPESRLSDAVEHLFAHELFHFWNGQRLRPAEPTRHVAWLTEGLTDYYALRILFESGVWDARTFAAWINRHIREYHANPAIDASLDEIERHFWDRRDTVGEVVYQRGLLLGLRWHRKAREAGVADGLDALLRRLLAAARADANLRVRNAMVRALGVELYGAWFGEEFDRFVIRGETIRVPADALLPELRGESQTVYAFDPGFDVPASVRRRRVVGLRRGSAAERAGLHEGDVLVAASVREDPDVPVKLTIRRDGRLRTIRYLPRGRAMVVMQFEPAK